MVFASQSVVGTVQLRGVLARPVLPEVRRDAGIPPSEPDIPDDVPRGREDQLAEVRRGTAREGLRNVLMGVFRLARNLRKIPEALNCLKPYRITHARGDRNPDRSENRDVNVYGKRPLQVPRGLIRLTRRNAHARQRADTHGNTHTLRHRPRYRGAQSLETTQLPIRQIFQGRYETPRVRGFSLGRGIARQGGRWR